MTGQVIRHLLGRGGHKLHTDDMDRLIHLSMNVVACSPGIVNHTKLIIRLLNQEALERSPTTAPKARIQLTPGQAGTTEALGLFLFGDALDFCSMPAWR